MLSTQRRYLATIVLFGTASLAVLAFLAFRPGDRISYELPELAPFDREDVTSITIDRSGGPVTLLQEGGRWRVSPGDYQADAANIDLVLSTVTEFALTDVVSVSDDPSRYDLGESGRVRVTVEGGGETLRVFDVGRRAATFGHTFVRIRGDDRILQGSGDLRSVFDRDLDAFRDKSVLVFDPSTIFAITVTRELPPARPRTVRVVRSLTGWEQAPDAGATATGVGPLDPHGIESALRFMGNLPAYRYRYGDDPIGEPWLSVILEGEQTYTLELYPEKASVYPAKSSGSPYVFDMFLFQAGLITEPFGFD